MARPAVSGRLVRSRPVGLASLLTGLVQGGGTTWGVFRHYWVVFKLLINVVATTLLLMYMETFRSMADVAADPNAELSAVGNASPLLHAAVAAVLLITATVLAVYKHAARRGMDAVAPATSACDRSRRAASIPPMARNACTGCGCDECPCPECQQKK